MTDSAPTSQRDVDWRSSEGLRNWKRLLQDGKEVLSGAERLLHKHTPKLDSTARLEVQEALERLRVVLTASTPTPAEGQPEALQQALAIADQAISRHLGHLRKSATREYVEAIAWAMLLTVVIRAFVFEAFKIPTGSMIPTLQIQDHLFVNKFLYGLKIPFTRIKFFAFRQPKPGEVVVFEYPYDDDPDSSGKDLIKRVIAVGGQRVRLRDNHLIIDGKPIPRKLVDASGDCGREQGGLRCEVARECLGGIVYTTQHYTGGAPGEPSMLGNPNWPFSELDEGNYGPQAQIYRADLNKDWPDFVVPEGQLLVMGDNRDNSKDGRFFGLVPLNTVKGKAGIRWYATDTSRIGDLIHEQTPDGTCSGF